MNHKYHVCAYCMISVNNMLLLYMVFCCSNCYLTIYLSIYGHLYEHIMVLF